MLRSGPWCNGGLCHPGAEHCPGWSRVPRPRNLPLPVAARPQDCTKAKTRQNDEGRTFRSGARTPGRFSPSQGNVTRGLSDAGLPGCRARLGVLRSTQISASKSEPIVTNWREVFSHGRAFLAKLEMFNLIVMLPEKVAVGPWSPPWGLLALLAGGRRWGAGGEPVRRVCRVHVALATRHGASSRPCASEDKRTHDVRSDAHPRCSRSPTPAEGNDGDGAE